MTTTDAATSFATFRIRPDLKGQGLCEVNGQDLSYQVKRAALLVEAGKVPTLQLEMRGDGEIDGVGIVKVILDDAQAEVSLAQAVLRFLDSVDPVQLEQTVMEGSGMHNGPGAAFLAALKGMALA